VALGIHESAHQETITEEVEIVDEAALSTVRILFQGVANLEEQ